MHVNQMCAVLVCSKAWQRYFEDVRDPWPWVGGWQKCPKQQLLVSSHPFTVSQQPGHLCYLVALHKICTVTINCVRTFLTLFVVLCKTIPIYVVVPSILASFQTQSRMSRCAYQRLWHWSAGPGKAKNWAGSGSTMWLNLYNIMLPRSKHSRCLSLM